MGVALTFLPTGTSLFLNADEVFPTASVIKVAVVAEVFTQAAEGRLLLDERIPVTDDALVGGSGVLSLLTPGLRLPLRAALTYSIGVLALRRPFLHKLLDFEDESFALLMLVLESHTLRTTG